MIKKEGKIPVNARVDIDYSGKDPRIKFGYTSNNPKKDAMKQHSFGLHTLIIFFIIYIALGVIGGQIIEGDYPEQCSMTFDEGFANVSISIIGFEDGEYYNTSVSTNKRFVKGANITCDGNIYSIKFVKDNTIISLASIEEGFYHKSSNKVSALMGSLYLLSILYLFFVVVYYLNKLVTYLLLKSERYRKAFPIFNAKIMRSRRYMKFKPKDVENNMVEIPCFKNVELDYKTNGDFSKQLQRIKIREHTHYKYKKGKPTRKIERDNSSWYARFFFKETPKDGYLEVIYH